MGQIAPIRVLLPKFNALFKFQLFPTVVIFYMHGHFIIASPPPLPFYLCFWFWFFFFVLFFC